MSKNLIMKEIDDAIDDLVAILNIGGTPECANVGDTDEYNELTKDLETGLRDEIKGCIVSYIEKHIQE